MFLDCEKKPEYLERTQAGVGETCRSPGLTYFLSEFAQMFIWWTSQILILIFKATSCSCEYSILRSLGGHPLHKCLILWRKKTSIIIKGFLFISFFTFFIHLFYRWHPWYSWNGPHLRAARINHIFLLLANPLHWAIWLEVLCLRAPQL